MAGCGRTGLDLNTWKSSYITVYHVSLHISFTTSLLLTTAFINQARSLCAHGPYISEAACSGFVFLCRLRGNRGWNAMNAMVGDIDVRDDGWRDHLGRGASHAGLRAAGDIDSCYSIFLRKGRLLITEQCRTVTESTLYPLLGNIGNEFRINYGWGVILFCFVFLRLFS